MLPAPLAETRDWDGCVNVVGATGPRPRARQQAPLQAARKLWAGAVADHPTVGAAGQCAGALDGAVGWVGAARHAGGGDHADYVRAGGSDRTRRVAGRARLATHRAVGVARVVAERARATGHVAGRAAGVVRIANGSRHADSRRAPRAPARRQRTSRECAAWEAPARGPPAKQAARDRRIEAALREVDCTLGALPHQAFARLLRARGGSAPS